MPHAGASFDGWPALPPEVQEKTILELQPKEKPAELQSCDLNLEIGDTPVIDTPMGNAFSSRVEKTRAPDVVRRAKEGLAAAARRRRTGSSQVARPAEILARREDLPGF
jgi:hypothetical protein